MQLLTDNY